MSLPPPLGPYLPLRPPVVVMSPTVTTGSRGPPTPSRSEP